jgi:hypothetical protein
MLPVRCHGVVTRRATNESLNAIPFIKFHIRLSSTAVVPLSAMPTGMLLRSLFIATISSNRFLLIPSLKLLSFLAKDGRSLPFSVDRNPILHGILKRTVYNQFCAGETVKEANTCIRQLKNLGFRGVIMTYAKELVFDRNAKVEFHVGDGTEIAPEGKKQIEICKEIEQWKTGTLSTVDLIQEGDILAIK